MGRCARLRRTATRRKQVKRLCRIARLGTIQPKEPDYAAAFKAIGPAAIKLGQTLATRPDIVGRTRRAIC